MFPLQLEELQTQADLGYMERVFVLDQTDEEAAAVRPKPQMFCASIPRMCLTADVGFVCMRRLSRR